MWLFTIRTLAVTCVLGFTCSLQSIQVAASDTQVSAADQAEVIPGGVCGDQIRHFFMDSLFSQRVPRSTAANY